MQKNLSELKLPRINIKTNKNPSQQSTQRSSSRKSLQNFLNEVREQQKHAKQWQQNKKQQGMKRMSRIKQKYDNISKYQIKRYDDKQRISMCHEDQDIIQEENLCAFLYKYDTMYKPSHRYKTALAFHEDQLLLFGGFGCQKYLGLARYSIKKQEWSVPHVQDKNDTAVYGHTMMAYKGFAYIFGGIKMDSPSSQLVQINLKTPDSVQVNSAPFRRRDHAAAFLARFMIIQGGIQGQEVKNNLFYLDTQNLKWSVPQQYQMPYLSHHSIVVVPQKNRRKQYSFHEVLGENLYIFGGKNQRESSSNRLYRVKVRQSNDLTTEQIIAKGAPYPRFSACVQFIDPQYICVYGGKSDVELTNTNMQKGIFNNLSLFQIDKKEWIVPTISKDLPFRFGASCVSNKNKLYIFGGSEVNNYSDGVLLQILIAKQGQQEQMQQIIHRRGRFRG